MLVDFSLGGERVQAPQGDLAFHQWLEADASARALFYRRGSEYLVRFPDWADFEVSGDGCNVQGWAAPSVPLTVLESLYRNQIYPLALARQEKLVLHASAVNLAGRALAFSGESGRGKSTMATSLAKEGFPFLTDDGLLLEPVSGGRWQAAPNQSSVRLWKDSRIALFGEEAIMAPALLYTKKRALLASPKVLHCNESRPLHRIYFLGEGKVSSVQLVRLKPADALNELARSAFVLDLVKAEGLARHFERLCALASLPIHYRLDYPRNYDYLPRVQAAIVQHALEEESEMT